MVDARLADGSRVNAIIPPLALDGPILSIRRFGAERLTINDLIQFNSLPPQIAEVAAACVKSRLNMLVSGGTGAGKTTLLNCLSNYIPENERIVTIEDSAELKLQQQHVVRLETRPPNIEGQGTVTARDLVRNALRMRPDRIVVGEVRGAEVRELLAALNTGHEGGCGTVHANAPEDVVARFEALGALAGLGPAAVRAQLAAAVDVVIHVTRRGASRRVQTISALFRRGGDPVVETALSWEETGRGSIVGPGWPALAHRLGLDPASTADDDGPMQRSWGTGSAGQRSGT
jgi:pilus assembly protein CpaF